MTQKERSLDTSICANRVRGIAVIHYFLTRKQMVSQ